MDESAGQIEALRRMLRVRRFEERVGRLNASGGLGFATVHLCNGQEATAVGACGALEPADEITGTHRGHGHSLAKGLAVDRTMAELYGRTEGYCGGKGGSMHVADPSCGMLGANGVVGAGVPLATGSALTSALEETGKVALSFIGDGAVAQGQVHEALNLAATWDLPVVVLVENNGVAEFTLAEKQHNVDRLADAAAAYGIPGEVVDGMDVEAVYEAVLTARERAARGAGPTLIEAETYRYRGHFEADPEPYRESEEVEAVRAERDPIRTYRERLVERGTLTESAYDALCEEVDAEIEDAVAFAEGGDRPTPDDAYEDVFVDQVPEIDRFRRALDAPRGEWL